MRRRSGLLPTLGALALMLGVYALERFAGGVDFTWPGRGAAGVVEAPASEDGARRIGEAFAQGRSGLVVETAGLVEAVLRMTGRARGISVSSCA